MRVLASTMSSRTATSPVAMEPHISHDHNAGCGDAIGNDTIRTTSLGQVVLGCPVPKTMSWRSSRKLP